VLGPPVGHHGAVPAVLERLERRVRTVPFPVWILVGMMGVYVAVFGTLTWQQQSRFATFGFDMGIYDQGIWLLSRFRDPFVTVRGLDWFGHHVVVITFLFVPFYWLGAGPHFLYLVQTVWLAFGAVPIWLLARDRLENPWTALPLAAAYLLYPSLEWINWWHFHPDALAITPLLFAYWLAHRRRWGWFAVAAGLAVMCKEDAALAVVMLGLLIAWKVERRAGIVTAVLAAAWFVLATRVIIPAANGVGTFYESYFAGFGDGSSEIAYNIVRHPSRVAEAATGEGRFTYYRQLLAPVALLPLAALPVLAIAAPQLLINVISEFGYTHSIRYHYSSLLVVGVMLATVESTARLGWTEGGRRFLVGLVAATALATNVAWSPSPLGVEYDSGIWARPSPRHATMREALSLVPAGANVTAIYYLVPHLTHREIVYEWPNPFVQPPANWGVKGEHPGDPAEVEYLALDTGLVGDDRRALYEALTAPGGQFRKLFERDQVVVAKRVRQEGAGAGG
jgi:uncharacterized membrane protein